MAINIKELFDIDSDSVRLEKINYNFDQIVANGGGPVGLQGAKGDVGPLGAKGQKGEIGTQGSKGEPGTATDYFYQNDSGTNYSVYPLSDDSHDPLRPATLVTGVYVTVTDQSNVEDYEASPILVNFDPNEQESAIRIVENGNSGTGFTKGVDILFVNATQPKFIIKATTLVSPIDYEFQGRTLDIKTSAGTQVSLGANSIFNGDLTLNGALKLTSGATNDYYLKSDSTGNAAWSALPLTIVPIGTIVMVGKSVLANNVDWVGSGLLIGDSWVGRGTGAWAGWYFCWGQTWGKLTTFDKETPDLRERYPMGFAGTSGGSLISGASEEAKYAAAGRAVHSTSGTAGYFGTNDVDQLQAKSTLNTHVHNITTTNANVAAGTDYWVPSLGSQYGQMQTGNPTTTPTTDITPRSAVVGFMIYLGVTSYVYQQ